MISWKDYSLKNEFNSLWASIIIGIIEIIIGGINLVGQKREWHKHAN
jgi:hypothetical protein